MAADLPRFRAAVQGINHDNTRNFNTASAFRGSLLGKFAQRISARQSTPALSAEVWLKIAEQMDIHEWAKASGTCRATWQLQLDVVRLESELSYEGILWILKRARQARQLVFGPFDNIVDKETAALSVIQAQSNWAFLKALDFEGLGGVGDEVADPGAGYAMLMWVLGRARELKYLRLNCGALQPFPPYCNLKHLQIMFHTEKHDISSCLSTLDMLETLSLSCYESGGLQRPDLCFVALERLHSLMLDGLVPETLVLPEVTALHIRVYSIDDVNEDVWAPHASRLRSLCVAANREEVDAADKLPSFLLHSVATGLKSLTLVAGSLGTRQAPFRLLGAFLQVQLLHLRTRKAMHLDIPEGLFPWRKVALHSCEALSIRMQSVPDFANSCREFSFRFDNLRGPDLLRMCSYMTAEGRPYAQDGGMGCSFVYSCGAPLVKYDEIMQNFGDVWTLWEWLDGMQLTPDGLIPRTF